MVAALTLRGRRAGVAVLISHAIGALLGAVFLEILPHAVRHSTNIHALATTIPSGYWSWKTGAMASLPP